MENKMTLKLKEKLEHIAGVLPGSHIRVLIANLLTFLAVAGLYVELQRRLYIMS